MGKLYGTEISPQVLAAYNKAKTAGEAEAQDRRIADELWRIGVRGNGAAL